MRVIHTPKNPSGLASHLAHAERSLGLDSSLITTRRDFTNREADKCYELQEQRGLSYLAGHVSALRELPDTDVLNLWYGATYLHWPRFGASLVDLKRLAKQARVFATYVGSDARRMLQRGGALQVAAEESLGGRFPARQLQRLDGQQRRAIDKMAGIAEHLFAVNPDLFRDLPNEITTFLPYPVAVDLSSLQSQAAEDAPEGLRPLRVLHAPSNPALKGSVYVDAAIERIESDRPGSIDYRRVGKISHREFIVELTAADLFVDQLLIGWYGVSAVESMLVDTPTVCFLDENDLGVLPPGMGDDIPVMQADPTSIESVLRSAVADRDALADLARRGRAYAEQWHAPRPAAIMTADAYGWRPLG